MSALPIDAVLARLLDAVSTHPRVVLVAPPGAGKTTRVPPALAEVPGAGRVLLLEPRRLAARAAAERMAAERRERVGDHVGLRMRGDSRVGPATRIEVITEGVLSRMLDADPSLDGVGAVVFDEFHERSLDADLGLALTLDVQRLLRPDLRVVVMSATLNDVRIAEVLGAATPVVRADIGLHAVDREWRPPPVGTDLVTAAVGAVADAHRSLRPATSVLAFLPGAPEIRRAERLLSALKISVHTLYGSGGYEAQGRALAPMGDTERRVVLATTIAQTSLTVPGVAVVIDSGLARASVFEPRTGLSRLVTTSISRATADQRAGRAGRLGPGRCVRLWSEANHAQRPAFDPPAILDADLTSFALTLACWGTALDELVFVDPPPVGALAAARDTLLRLGAVDDHGRATAEGRALASVPVHPRIAHLMRRVATGGTSAVRRRAVLCALIESGARLPHGADLDSAVLAVDAPSDELRTWAAGIRSDADRLARIVPATPSPVPQPSWSTGAMLALAYPDRIAVRHPDAPDRFDLADGVVTLADGDPLLGASLLVVADVDGNRRGGRIWAAARVTAAELVEIDPGGLHTATSVTWSTDPPAADAVLSVTEEQTWRGAVVGRRAVPVDPSTARSAAIEAVRRHGLGVLGAAHRRDPTTDRLRFLAAVRPDLTWAAVDDVTLLDDLGWLHAWLPGPDQRRPLAGVDVSAAILGRLSHAERRRLDTEVPTHLVLPTGSAVPLSYEHGRPEARARIQEVFGQERTPTVAGVPVLLDLMSPANRPAARTDDLARFWEVGYPQVRAELRGRYPKHDWPENPRLAPPHRGAKRRTAREKT